MKTIFFGTPETAVPFLRLLAQKTQLLAAVSQPDKPAGRGLSVTPTPVKAAAVESGVRVFQPQRPAEIVAPLRELGADLAVVVAYGRILTTDVLATARLGFMNAHFSLLPKYRGAAPVQWSLARGETRTGVTLFWLDQGMDTGPVQAQRETAVDPDEDAGALLQRLTTLGVEMLDTELAALAADRIIRRPQEGRTTDAPLIKREHARIDLTRPAARIHDQVRAFKMWPRAYLEGAAQSGTRLGVLRTVRAAAEDPPGPGRVGRILAIDRARGILIQCGSSSRLWFLTVQPEGKKTLNAVDFVNGLRLGAGDFLPFTEVEIERERE